MRLIEVGPGTAMFELPLTDWLRTPQGAISIGPLVMPADAAMACAIQTTLPARTPFSTSELTLRLLAPARLGRRLRVQGRVILARQRIALAEGSLIDDEDQLIAHGSTLCLMQPEVAPPAGPAPERTSDAGRAIPTERPTRGSDPRTERFSARTCSRSSTVSACCAPSSRASSQLRRSTT